MPAIHFAAAVRPTAREEAWPLSNFPLFYRLGWAPRLFAPSLRNRGGELAPRAGTLMQNWPRETVRLIFLGDISAVANRETPICDPQLQQLLASADLVVANCESPVVRRPLSPFRTRLGTRHAMDMRFLIGLLAEIGVEPARLALSLANNHVLDQGIAGFEQTVEALDHLGIDLIGTAKGGLQRLDVGGVTVGLLAFTQWRNASAAAFKGRVIEPKRAVRLLEGAADTVDLLCAVPHWDWEFQHFPRAETRELAARLDRKGVRLIAGHHAHVLQSVEQVGDALVAYGLGDFLGTAWTWQTWPGRIGAMLVAEVSADIATRGQVAGYEIVPFMRLSDGNRERLTPLSALAEAQRLRAEKRLDAIFGTD